MGNNHCHPLKKQIREELGRVMLQRRLGLDHLAELMETSRQAVHQLFSCHGALSVNFLHGAADALGYRWRLSLEQKGNGDGRGVTVEEKGSSSGGINETVLDQIRGQIRLRLKMLGWTQQDLANKFGIKTQNITRMLNTGKVTLPRIEEIAGVLGMRMKVVFEPVGGRQF